MIALYLLQDGIANGAVYALLGLAIILVFSVSRIIFLPQGEFVSFSALTFVFLQEGLFPATIGLLGALIVMAGLIELAGGMRSRGMRAGARNAGRLCAVPGGVAIVAALTATMELPLLVQALLTIAIVGASGPLVYRLVYEPIRDESILVLLIVSVALHFTMVGLGLYFFGPEGVRSAPLVGGTISILDAPIPRQSLVIIFISGVMVLGLYWMSRHTYYGKAMRAAAINRTGARLIGLSSAMVGRTSFLLAALIGAVSGVLISPVVTIHYDTGFLLGLKGFVGAIFGGLGSYPIGALGALTVGLLESYASFVLSAYKEVIVFCLIMPALVFRSLVERHFTESDEEESRLEAGGRQSGVASGGGGLPARRLLVVLLVAAVAIAPLLLSDYRITILNYVGLAALVVLGLMLLTGAAGLTSFGQAAFVGIGAYVTGHLSAIHGISPWISLSVAVLAVVLLSYLAAIVTVRLSGHYLPVATLAIAVSVYYLFASSEVIGGQSGLGGIQPLIVAGYGLSKPLPFYYFLWGVVLLSILALRNLLDSRPGRAIRALKHGAAMAEAMGINTIRSKIVSFIIACTLAGASGGLYAHFQRFISPAPFSINQGIEYLFMGVIGGIGAIGGAVVGAGSVVVLKEWLQDLLPLALGAAGDFEMIVFGVITVLMLQFAPGGLWQRIAALEGPWASQKKPVSLDTAERLPVRRKPVAGDTVLRVKGISKSFGGIVANHDVSFDVHAGDIVALIGPNGAGKTTLFNVISSVLPPTGGGVEFLGRPVLGRATRDLVQWGMARTFQHVKILPEMSVLENAALGAHSRSAVGVTSAVLRLDRKAEQQMLAEALRQLQRVGLADLVHSNARNLSLGQQRILEVARALSADPCLLLLDEPAAGLRLAEKRELAALLLQLKQEGMTVLLVEHDMDFIMNLADRVIVMNFGSKLAEGSPAEIQKNPQVLDAYLGGAS